MAWFSEDLSAFLRDLSENNNKEWFEANKKRYENSVKKPLEAFAGELIPRMQLIDPSITTTPKQAVFRIYRDTRFSKDKAPYKENAAMVIAPGGRHEPGKVGLYFNTDKEQMVIASGLYFVEPAQLAKVRQHIVDTGPELRRLLADKDFVQHFGELQGEKNKVLPAEFKAAAVVEPLVANKQFFYWASYPAKELLREDLPDFVMAHMLACQPLNLFLTTPLR